MFEGTIIKVVVDKLAKSEPRTTLAGAALGAVVAANIDYGKLMQKDPVQIGNLVGAVLTVALGYWMNHGDLVAKKP